MTDVSELEQLHADLLTAWNERDAAAYAACFEPDGSLVGFDGSTITTAAAVAEHLGGIFADHTPATYVWIVRETRSLGADVALLRADVGMVPPDGNDITSENNAVQSLVAVRSAAGSPWRIAHLQNTPARFDGRPADAAALTDELRRVLAAGR